MMVMNTLDSNEELSSVEPRSKQTSGDIHFRGLRRPMKKRKDLLDSICREAMMISGWQSSLLQIPFQTIKSY